MEKERLDKERLDKERQEPLIEEFMDQLTPSQKIAYEIAKRNLGSSFNLSLSIGFLEYKKANTPKK